VFDESVLLFHFFNPVAGFHWGGWSFVFVLAVCVCIPKMVELRPVPISGAGSVRLMLLGRRLVFDSVPLL